MNGEDVKIGRFNPQWSKNILTITKGTYKRKILYKILNLIDTEDNIIIYGPLGIGKTTLIGQVIDNLLNEGVEPSHILYISLEEEGVLLEDELSYYERKILKRKLSSVGDTVYLFMDEVQYYDNWNRIISEFKRDNEKVKIIATSSYIREKPENYTDIYIKPLSFREYLDFKGIYVDDVNLEIYDLRRKYVEYLDLSDIFDNYILTGGFPSLINIDNIRNLSIKARNEILNKIIYLMIPRTEKRREPYLIERILRFIFMNMGEPLNFNMLSKSLNKDIRTVLNYVDIALRSFLVYEIRNKIRGGRGSKKLPKIYSYSPAYIHALYPDKLRLDDYIGRVIESIVALHIDAKYYWRKGNREIHILWDRDGREMPIIVKYIKRLSKRDIKKIETTLKKIDMQHGIVLAKDTFEIVKRKRDIWIMPPWLFLLTLQ
jgi:hypothetical protein